MLEVKSKPSTARVRQKPIFLKVGRRYNCATTTFFDKLRCKWNDTALYGQVNVTYSIFLASSDLWYLNGTRYWRLRNTIPQMRKRANFLDKWQRFLIYNLLIWCVADQEEVYLVRICQLNSVECMFCDHLKAFPMDSIIIARNV